MDSTDEMETNNYLQLRCLFMLELFIKMVKYKDLTENKWKTSQFQRNTMTDLQKAWRNIGYWKQNIKKNEE